MKRTAYSLLLLASLGLAAASAAPGGGSWEATYHERQTWWSLQPVRSLAPRAVKNPGWCRTEVDRFILAGLEQAALPPAPEAGARTLARRLSFALTGLPPRPEEVEAFVHASSLSHYPTFPPAPAQAGEPVGKRESELAYERLVDSLLASPHFGERWARHWMDVVHYTDTHGYEWDAPAKHAWRYRDYLVRAFNADVPFKQLILEQLAGDLLPSRADTHTGLNESLLGPMAMRLGERRHGDNAAAEGVTQEAIANIIDTVGKGFLGTTVACAQCHDHKLDAISQRDYYALAGIFMSTRWGARSADAVDPNEAVLAELRRHKQALRTALAKLSRAAAGETHRAARRRETNARLPRLACVALAANAAALDQRPRPRHRVAETARGVPARAREARHSQPDEPHPSRRLHPRRRTRRLALGRPRHEARLRSRRRVGRGR